MKRALQVLAVGFLCGSLHAQQAVKVLETGSGTRFGIVGTKQARPAPILFLFATSLEQTLENPQFSEVGRLVAQHGVLQVSLDLPSHGKEQPSDEKNSLRHWRTRLEKGEDFLAPFLKRVSEVLDYLIQQGYTDPERVAACGTSRGGFSALLFTSAEPRVRTVVAFAPVTDLPALNEFAGMESHARTRSLALVHAASRLADRAVWMCIGSTDHRVGTSNAIRFFQRIVEAAEAQGIRPDFELHVMPTEGHRIHTTAHEEAARWLARKMRLE